MKGANASVHTTPPGMRFPGSAGGVVLRSSVEASGVAETGCHSAIPCRHTRVDAVSSPEHRHKLVWLCWYDLMMGATLEDWLDNLKRKAPEDLGLWLVGRQEENISLTQMMDEYLLFTGH